MRKQFEMTQEQLDTIMEACRPVPLIALNCGMPSSPQENANRAWEALGKELGFKHMTVKPNVKGDRFFSAEEVEDKEKLSELLDSTSSSSECPQCGGERAWCDICDMWSSTCCEEYGTCECS